MKLLHVIATPRQAESRSLQVADAFLSALRARTPDLDIEDIDLFHQDLPAVAGTNIETKYDLMVGRPIDPNHAESWHQIELLVEQFVAADGYLVTVPMWNFSIPYALKYYIDCIVQPGYTFRFTEEGIPVPMVTGKSMVCITSRGGDYSPGSPMHPYDFQEPYLRAIFGYIGVTDIDFVNVQPMDVTPELRDLALADAVETVQTLARSTYDVLAGVELAGA